MRQERRDLYRWKRKRKDEEKRESRDKHPERTGKEKGRGRVGKRITKAVMR